MYKLGLHIGHNASCALMKDGKVLYVGQEERFTRIKNIMGFPKLALEHGFKTLGISGKDIDEACYSSIVDHALFTKASNITNFTIRDYYEYYGERFYEKVFKGESVLDYLKWLRDDKQFNSHPNHFDFSFLTDEMLLKEDEWVAHFQKEERRFLSETFEIPNEKIRFTDHHTGHAYYAYYGSPFRGKDCGILVLDGSGDGRNQTVWEVKDDNITNIASTIENDIGRVYKLATLLLGMRPDEHEYKVMGLAPYAKDKYIDKAYEALKDLSEVKDMKIHNKNRPENLFEHLKSAWIDQRFDNIGGAVQRFSEEMARDLIQDIHDNTGLRRFVISGGIALNVKMNKIIAEMDCVDEFFVCGSGADESLSIGGCYILNDNSKTAKPLENNYLGLDAANHQDDELWSQILEKYDVHDNVTNDEIADILAQGNVIARVWGRAEFGARALGHRSILADPSKRESVHHINEAIKSRDFWMPFALSILEEYASDYIVNPKNIQAPYMTIAFDTKPENYKKIQAGTHPYDKTVRPQIVTKEAAADYHELIEAFRQKTGIPGLLNTSFNLHGEPIVNTLKDAIHTLENSGLNYLVYQDRLVEKRVKD